MEELFTSGRIVDLILVLMAVEYIALWFYLGRGIAGLGLAGYLASGALLLLALRVALTGGAWMWIAGLLAAAFAVHLFDLRRRLIS